MEPAILDRSVLNELSTPDSGDYAAGWSVYQRNWADGTALNHNGSNAYWYSVLWIAPERGLAYVAVANSADIFEDRGVLQLLDSIIFSLIRDSEISRVASGAAGNGQARASERRWLLDPAAVRSVTGAQAPWFIGAEVSEGVSDLIRAANSVLASDLLIFTDDEPAVRGQSECLDGDCSSVIAGAVQSLSASDVRFGDAALAYQAIASHHGVSLAEGRSETQLSGATVDYNLYGGWLQHGFFAVEAGKVADGLYQGLPVFHSYAVGNAANTNPVAGSGSGSWRGVMVGADVSQTATHGHLIQGEAEITIEDFDDPHASVAFTQVFDLDTRMQRSDMIWDDTQVTAGGFASGADQDSIEGRFWGPDHEEVGGVFERDQVLGAFGGVRAP